MKFFDASAYKKAKRIANALISAGQLYGAILGGIAVQVLGQNSVFLVGALLGILAAAVELPMSDTYPTCSSAERVSSVPILLREVCKSRFLLCVLTAVPNFVMFAVITA